MLITDELVESCARKFAVMALGYYPLNRENMEPFRKQARAALSIAVVEITEACAKLCEDAEGGYVLEDVACEIRALARE